MPGAGRTAYESGPFWTRPPRDGLFEAGSRLTAVTDLNLEYPRPHLVRDRWTDLTGSWQFGYDADDVGVDERWYALDDLADRRVFDRDIRVPYPPESPASGVGERGYHRVVWYRRTFDRADAAD